MTVEHWLASACADAERRNLPELKPLLTALAGAATALRHADWNDDAAGPTSGPDDPGLWRHSPGPEGPGLLTHSSGPATGPARDADHRPFQFRSIADLAPLIAAGTLSAEDLTRACLQRDRRAQRRPAGVHHGHGRRRPWPRHGPSMPRPHPVTTAARCTASRCRLKDLIDQRGVADHGGVTRARRTRRGIGRDGDAQAPRRGRRPHRQDEPARVRVRHDERRHGVRRGAQSARTRAITGRLERRFRRGRSSRACRSPRSAPTPAARSGSRRPPAARWA